MRWVGILIDVVILSGLVIALRRGWRIGFSGVIFDTTSLVLATIIGFGGYQTISPWIGHHLPVTPVLVPLISFFLIVLLLETLYVLVWRLGTRAHHHPQSGPIAATIAAALSGLAYLVLIGFVVMVMVGLPIPAGLKADLTASDIASIVLASTNQFQSEIDHVINQDLSSTLNFLTTEPKSDTATIELGYTVTSGRVRPDLEAKMLVLVNNERASYGLSALSVNSGAQAVAIAHSQDMFARGYFSHYTPEGIDPFKRMHDGDVTFSAAGENIALAPTLSLAHQGLMNSPPHRANILDPDFHTVGIGIIDGGRYGLMVTQDFTN